MNQQAEMDFLINFAEENSFDEEVSCEQLRSLWTAYCLHFDLEADTQEYDDGLVAVWSVICRNETDTAYWHNFQTFSNFMCAELV